MDQIIYQFENERQIIFNQKQDLILIEPLSRARVADLVTLRLLMEGGREFRIILMTDKMYEDLLADN